MLFIGNRIPVECCSTSSNVSSKLDWREKNKTFETTKGTITLTEKMTSVDSLDICDAISLLFTDLALESSAAKCSAFVRN